MPHEAVLHEGLADNGFRTCQSFWEYMNLGFGPEKISARGAGCCGRGTEIGLRHPCRAHAGVHRLAHRVPKEVEVAELATLGDLKHILDVVQPVLSEVEHLERGVPVDCVRDHVDLIVVEPKLLKHLMCTKIGYNPDLAVSERKLGNVLQGGDARDLGDRVVGKDDGVELDAGPQARDLADVVVVGDERLELRHLVQGVQRRDLCRDR